jgi:hypothetical protein
MSRKESADRISAKRAEQLGMSFGKARNKLVNIIFLHLAKLSGTSACFKCGKEIVSPNEISIEHKKPWLDVSPDLFWNLDNIAFSHRKCNKADRTPRNRKIGPEGTSWCSVHKDFLPIENFWKNPTIWNGISRQCVECMTKADSRINHDKYVKKSLRVSSVTVASPSPKR